MTNLSTLTMKCIGADRAVVTPTPPTIMYDPRKGYAAVIAYRPRGVQYTVRVTLPWCTTREGAKYTSEVATHFLMRPDMVPAAQEMGTPLARAATPCPPFTLSAVLAHKARRAAPGSPPARRPPQR